MAIFDYCGQTVCCLVYRTTVQDYKSVKKTKQSISGGEKRLNFFHVFYKNVVVKKSGYDT